MTRTRLLTLAALGGAAVAARRRTDPSRPWPDLSGSAMPVTADDGVVLHAEVHGPEDAPGTVVLAHGYVLSNRLWDLQVAALREARPDLRVVTYDQRGHGRSERTHPDRATIAQLGHDLRAVLDATSAGPAVVAGHSMGGMTVMAFAEHYPELIGSRVVGAGLVATSSGGLDESTWGLPEPVARVVREALPALNERARRREDAGRRPLPPHLLRPVLFGKDAPRPHVRRTFEVMAGCSAHTVADFHLTFTDHDRSEALAALHEVPVTVLCGTRDRLCPLPHSEAMAAALPHARFVVYPDAGHMLQLERAEEVSRHLVELAEVLPQDVPARTFA
ncbi:MAG: alpha/beta hydrolase [Mycobacteriales bacterium]